MLHMYSLSVSVVTFSLLWSIKAFFQCYYSKLCPFLPSRYATSYQYCSKFSEGSPTAAKATAPRRNGTPVGGSSCTKLHHRTIQVQYWKELHVTPRSTEQYWRKYVCCNLYAWPRPYPASLILWPKKDRKDRIYKKNCFVSPSPSHWETQITCGTW